MSEELPPLRDVIAKYGLRAAKALGQNFLLDRQLLDRIAAIPGSLAGETVYEVGPGPGGLTRALLEAGAKVIAVERDTRCIAALAELAVHYPGSLFVHEADALTVDERALGADGAHIVSNLPYNIGSALFVRWLTCAQWPPWWQSLTLMFQEEVARRIVASPGDSEYGRISVLAQWRCHAKLALKVHRSAFVPPPKVMSAVVHLTPRETAANPNVSTIESLTQAAFGQRRKMLRQSLKKLPRSLEILEVLSIDSSQRAEELSVDDYAAIATEMDRIRG